MEIQKICFKNKTLRTRLAGLLFLLRGHRCGHVFGFALQGFHEEIRGGGFGCCSLVLFQGCDGGREGVAHLPAEL